MEKQIHAIGDRVEKLCPSCGEERGHVIASLTKRGQISRVDCPKCGERSTFKSNAKLTGRRAVAEASAPYDRMRTYRAGQVLTHPTFGIGEVTALIEPQKMDVLFTDRLRRLIHSRA